MYQHILIPIALDHEHDNAGAIRIARHLLRDGGKLTALHVMEALPSYATEFLPDDNLKSYHRETANALHIELRDQPGLTPVVVLGHAGRSIVDYAQQHGVDCIVMASHRPGLQDYFLGSTAARVVRHAMCSVHVIR
jgi:universal stress protein F